MHKILVSKFQLELNKKDFMEIPLQLPPLSSPAFLPRLFALLASARGVNMIFISNPQFGEMIFCYLARLFFGKNLLIVFFDIILRPPLTAKERVVVSVKRKLLAVVDWFLCIHKDVSGYEHYFGVDSKRCHYVPFKANNFDLADKIPTKDGDYILALGASHRDYQLLIDAVAGLDVAVKIILPHASIQMHNALFSETNLPRNVEHIGEGVDRLRWSQYIAESKFIAIPILPNVIQPAGISVYLEAMVFGKPVLVTSGASTQGILDDSLAVLVPPGDVDAMRAAIMQLWQDGELRERLSKASKKYALALGGHDRLVRDIRSFIEKLLVSRQASC